MVDVTLESLVGPHKLSGVSYVGQYGKKTEWGEIASAIYFTLDGVTYVAIEDPADGYRSMMTAMLISDDAPSNTFDPVDVVANLNDDILEFTDIKSGLVVLRVGTDYSADYYPSFVSDWQPGNLAVNLKDANTP